MNEQHVWLHCADGVRKKRPENGQFVKIHSHFKNCHSSQTKLILAKRVQTNKNYLVTFVTEQDNEMDGLAPKQLTDVYICSGRFHVLSRRQNRLTFETIYSQLNDDKVIQHELKKVQRSVHHA